VAAGLEGLAGRPVNALSSGERQLASLARALAQDPDIYLLDEPLSHLDIANSRRVFGLMDAQRRSGKTVIFTTHDPNCASAIADEAVLLRAGRRLAAGPSAEVLTAAHLSETYGVDVPVTIINGRPVVLPRI
jgi:iron complex transport system ATP-binding protein